MIRQLTTLDAPLLRSLRIRALTDAPSAFGSTLNETVEHPMSTWEHMLRTDGRLYFIYEVNGEVHGLAGGFSPEQDGVAHLVSMWIDPFHRGHGASNNLVNQVIDWARSISARCVSLECTEGNVYAENLYFRHGFRRTGVSNTRERDGVAEFEMLLELSALDQ